MGKGVGLVALTALFLAGLPACSGDGVETVAEGDEDIGVEVSDPGSYRCGPVVLSLDELETLASLPEPGVEAFEAVGVVGPLGERADWAVTATGALVDRRPLVDDGVTGLVVVDPESGIEPCIPQPGLQWPLTWSVAAPMVDGRLTIEVENCADPTTVNVQIAERDNRAVVWVAGDQGTVVAECALDGSTTVEVDLPAGVTEVVSGHVWPLAPPDARMSPIEAPDLDSVRCEARGDLAGITISWWGVPAGASFEVITGGESRFSGGPLDPSERLLRSLEAAFLERLAHYGQATKAPGQAGELVDVADGVFSDFGALAAPLGVPRAYELRLTGAGTDLTVPCGEASIPSELAAPACTLSLFAGRPQLDLEPVEGMDYLPDRITVRRDGAVVELGHGFGPPVDGGATPGATHAYEVEIDDRLLGRAPVVVDCGTIAVPVLAAGGVDEIGAARERFQRSALGPHVYGAGEIDGTEVPIVMTFGATGYEFVEGFPAEERLNPFTVHDALIAAVEGGREVAYVLDPRSGLPRTWTIDGVTASYTCLSFDTAPLDLRPDASCPNDFSILGTGS